MTILAPYETRIYCLKDVDALFVSKRIMFKGLTHYLLVEKYACRKGERYKLEGRKLQSLKKYKEMVTAFEETTRPEFIRSVLMEDWKMINKEKKTVSNAGYCAMNGFKYLTTFITGMVYKCKCPACGAQEMEWANWGEVRAGEEYGVDILLKAKCNSCGALVTDNNMEVGDALGKQGGQDADSNS